MGLEQVYQGQHKGTALLFGDMTTAEQCDLQDLKFSQWCCWRFVCSAMCHCVVGCVVPDISKDCGPFIFRSSILHGLLDCEDESTAAACLRTQCHIPLDLSLHHYISPCSTLCMQA